MSDGITHGRTTIVFIPISGYIAYTINQSVETSLLISFGCFLGLFLDPDLDLVGKTESEKRVGKIPIFGWFWFLYWFPYGKFLKHRSFWSHTPLLGTFIRWVYLFAIPFILCYPIFNDQFYTYMAYIFLGNAVSDILHWIYDL